MDNTTGSLNTFLGMLTGTSNTTASSNVFIGDGSGFRTTTGGSNVFVGNNTGVYNVTGANNVVLGYSAGYNATGTGNVFLGNNAGYNETTSNKLYIANSGTTTPLIYGDFSTPNLQFNANVGVNRAYYSDVSLAVSPNSLSYGIYVDAGSAIAAAKFNGNIIVTTTTYTSDRRYKINILDFKGGLEKIRELQGVSFDWNLEKFPKNGFNNRKQIGFIAQDIEKVLPEIVEQDADGMKSVDYSKITVVLVEAMKEQQNQIEIIKSENEKLNNRVQELEEKNKELLKEASTLNQLKSEIDQLKTAVNELQSKH